MGPFLVNFNVYRAQRIFDQFYADEVSRDEAAAMLMRAFEIERCEAELLLDETPGG